MNTIYVRDDIVPGFNDGCRVLPAGGQRKRDRETYRAYMEFLREAAATKRGADSKPQRRARPVVVRDTSMDRLDHAIAALDADRAAELNARIGAMRNRPVPDHPGAGLNPWELAGQYRRSAEDQARICAESEAAYAARNPHTKENAR